ncbi:MAG TPA: mitofilin family membrane protein, partial [Stellaceae bacterium]
VTTLENRPAPDASTAVAPLAAQVQQFSAHLDQIDKQLAQLAHDAANNAASPQRMLMVALAGLGNAVAGSSPFSTELTSVEALGQNRQGWAAALQPLEAPAQAGIPSTAVLAQRFSTTVASAILRAQANAQSSQQSLGEAMLTRLRSLVIVRRIDGASGVDGDPTDQAVGEAQAALNKSDLGGAVKALAVLNGAAANAAEPWLKDAQQRLNAEQTIAKLSRDLVGEMTAGASGG